MQFQSLTPEQQDLMDDIGVLEQKLHQGDKTVLIYNIGRLESPCRYVVINDEEGNSVIIPDLFIN